MPDKINLKIRTRNGSTTVSSSGGSSVVKVNAVKTSYRSEDDKMLGLGGTPNDRNKAFYDQVRRNPVKPILGFDGKPVKEGGGAKMIVN